MASVTTTVGSGYHGKALVIGNANYVVPEMKLDDPIEDARSISDALTHLGWEVSKKTDLDDAAMLRAVDAFTSSLNSSGVGLLFYSGHGAQVGGVDYILPVDFQISQTDEFNIANRALSLSYILNKVRTASTRPNIVLLDACRDNPLSQNGLAQPTNIPNETIVGFSTNFGSLSVEGGEQVRYSPYTRAILRHINTPGLPVEEFFKQVRDSVREYTDSYQTPRESTALSVPFQFRPPVYLESQFRNADDEGLVLVNGEEVLSWNNDGQKVKKVALKQGDNVVTLKIYNQHSFTGGIPFPEGWNYTLTFRDNKGRILLDISDKEDAPDKDGPHFGKMFTAATIRLFVDAESDNIVVTKVDQEAWKR
jgi:hypothetical protein